MLNDIRGTFMWMLTSMPAAINEAFDIVLDVSDDVPMVNPNTTPNGWKWSIVDGVVAWRGIYIDLIRSTVRHALSVDRDAQDSDVVSTSLIAVPKLRYIAGNAVIPRAKERHWINGGD